MKNNLEKIFKDWSGEPVQSIIPLPGSGSSRRYFRMKSINHQAVGVYNSDKNENKTFIYFTNLFKKKKFNVPQIYNSDIDKNIYLVEDLGDETLFDYLNFNRPGNEFPEEAIDYYKSALINLIDFQIKTVEVIDFTACYPRECFDRQSMMWDLNYFKYYFLKMTGTPFDEQKLENDFDTLTGFLLTTAAGFFLYRDFQSRNIMIKDSRLFFIDYQGGRKGALQYDVASLLYDAKADIPQVVRELLFEFYVEKLQQKIKIDKVEFTKYYYGFVLIRILQAMGAYGFRGIHEKKAHFLKSIPYAVKNINYLLLENLLPPGLDELKSVLRNVTRNDKFKKFESITAHKKLIVSINSFSYKSGIPADLSGNDGGFVFDCRSLHNPGRYDEFRMLTGRDEQVINFLDEQNDVREFLEDIKSISERAINNYLQRGFSNLMINFGCTGGQHRSVYCAERLSDFIKIKFDVIVSLNHTELEKKDML